MRAAVLGSPVAHSLSPVLHRAAYAHFDLPWTYDAYECDEVGLPDRLAALRADPDWRGLSLTMPLKEAVLPLLDAVEGVAVRAAAANTVLFSSGRATGLNTDIPGLAAALVEAGVLPAGDDPVSVLGGGATARSALLALAGAGWAQARVYARSASRSAALQRAVDGTSLRVEVLPWESAADGLAASLVISTVPHDAAAVLATPLSLPPEVPGTLFDVIYAPWPTELAAAWRDRGGQVIGGLELLVHQGALQFLAMTGLDHPAEQVVPIMRAAGRAALDARSG